MNLVLLLIALSTGLVGERSFTVNQPYALSIAKMQAEAGRSTPVRIPASVKLASLTVSEDSANRRKLWFTSHLKIQDDRTGPVNLRLAGSIQEWDHATVIHAYTTAPDGYLAYGRTFVILSDAGKGRTLVRLHVELRPAIPAMRLRIAQRIADRIAGQLTAQAVAESLREGAASLQRMLGGKS